jgi:hypothetical protein
MSTLAPKPVKVRILNPRLLVIAAALLLVLALLFLATPLVRRSGGFQNSGNFPTQFNGQALPGGDNGFPTPAPGNIPGGQGFPGQGGTNTPGRQFGGGGGLMSFSLLEGMVGTIVYAIALLISLVAAAGMFIVKRWGKILGVIMAVFYGLLALVSLLPMLLISFTGINSLTALILGVLELLLAVAVIILASIPGRKGAPVPPAAPTVPAA